MRRLALLAFFTLALAMPLAAQVNDTYVIPATANVPGAFGTRWMTQFSVFNPQSYELRVRAVVVPTVGQTTTGLQATFRVPANSVAYSENILDDLFALGGSGALLVATFPEDNPGVPNDIVSRSFLLTTSTYNNSASGTYGQTIPAVWAGLQDYKTDGISAIAHGILNLDREGWRTNVGAANLGRYSVTMRVTVYDADGRTILSKAPFIIPPMSHFQERLPVQVDRGSIEFFVEDSSRDAVVFPYVSTIDQLSGDPTYQYPTLLATPSVLYGKTAIEVTSNPGRKIDINYARQLRANARDLGEAGLVRGAKGLRISMR